MLNWRRISTVEVPGLTEKFKSMRISPLTSKYYKKRVRHFRLTSQSSFFFLLAGCDENAFQFAGIVPSKPFELFDTPGGTDRQ